MVIEVTGMGGGLTPINRPQPSNTQAEKEVTPVTPTPRSDNRAPRQDVEVEMALRQRDASRRDQVEQSARIGEAQQQRVATLDVLNSERDRLTRNAELDLPVEERTALFANRAQQTEDTLEALQRIRENALADPFGTGDEDLGPLPADGFFSRDGNSRLLTELDSTISALERQSALAADRLTSVSETFNKSRDSQLSPGNSPIESREEAMRQAAQVSQQIREQTPLNVIGLTAEDRSAVLNALQI